ncbi:caspase, EACC1-associated type [Streptomyces sp. Marseille-Q5077]|uniref:caspase, EACC1-associated type n=1 Tax=Streptomyces sp. Marseille-Q5077 TaxID=3418995 RepID=UPI003D06D456
MIHHPDPAKSRAVLIGVTRYADAARWQPLPAIAANLADLKAVLTDPDLWGLAPEHCDVIEDPEDPTEVLVRVLSAASEAEDTVVVYFAGHGAILRSELVLPTATSTGDTLTARKISFADIREIIAARGARDAVIILDCCWSGMANAMSDVESAVDREIEEIEPSRSYILTSSARDSISIAIPGEKHTVFTGELLNTLNKGEPSPDRALTLRAVTSAVTRRLRERRMPRPRHSQGGDGDRLALVRNRQWRPSFGSDSDADGTGTPDTVSVPGSHCELRHYPEHFGPVDPDGARTTPSILLRADRAIVPFHGRERELVNFGVWREGGGARLRVLYAGGGQGKTRFARHLAEEWAKEGWRAWHAVRRPKQVSMLRPAVGGSWRSGDAGTLVVVDYADRWSTEELSGLLEFVASSGSAPLRVLLLARMTGHWWTALISRLPTIMALHNAVLLSSHTPEPGDRPREFQTAREGYARALGVPLDQVLPKPVDEQPDWSLRDFSLVLTVHMAALVDVLAQLSGSPVPVDPVGVSADLLAREHAQWEDSLGHRDFRGLTLDQVRRAVFVATITGGLPVRQARKALRRVGIRSDEVIDPLLNLHRQCYPPLDSARSSALEPLYPDRLGEDFLALTIPGHSADYPAQMEAQELAERLLLPSSSEPDGPPWTPYAMTMIAETARRWPHVASAVLHPLLRDHPKLAVRAGGIFLAGFAESTEYTDLLVRIREQLPSHRGADLAVGVAAIDRRLAPYDADRATTGVDLARSADERVRSYSRAGQSHDALREASRAVEAWRVLAEHHPHAYRAGLASALATLGSLELGAGQSEKSWGSVDEALQLVQQTEGPTLKPAVRSHILVNIASVLQRAGDEDRRAAAVRLADEAVRTIRAAGPGPDRQHEAGLADALTVLCAAYGNVGDIKKAREAGDEALVILGQLHAHAGGTSCFEELSEVLDLLGCLAADAGDLSTALKRGMAAVRTREMLAGENPAFEERLARSLCNLAGYHSDLAGRMFDPGKRGEAVAYHDKAAAYAEEALRRLRDRRGPAADRHDADVRAVAAVLVAILRRRNPEDPRADALQQRHGLVD